MRWGRNGRFLPNHIFFINYHEGKGNNEGKRCFENGFPFGTPQISGMYSTKVLYYWSCLPFNLGHYFKHIGNAM